MSQDTKTIMIVLLSGVLLLGGLFAFENFQTHEIDESEPVEEIETPEATNENAINIQLEKKIDSLKLKEFNLEDYSLLMTEIHSNYVNEAYTASIKLSLENKLIDTFSDLIFKQADSFLLRENRNSHQVLDRLNFAEQNGAPTTKVNYFKRQIKWHSYYAYTLPAKVNNFISGGITNYSDEEYEDFKEEILEMPNLDKKYHTTKFENLRKELIHNLGEFNLAFYSPNYEPEYINL
jgi:hypothetical protein